MTKLFDLDEYKVFDHFSEFQIETTAKELGLTYKEAIFYLWFWNYVSISPKDREEKHGEEMYKKFAKSTINLLEGRV